MIKIRIYTDPAAVAAAAANLFLQRLQDSGEQARHAVALSGGSTPKIMYSRLCSLAGVSQMINKRALFFFSDERAVPPESEQSNYHTAAISLFQPLKIDEHIVERLRGEAPDLQTEARRYELVLRNRVPSANNGIPRFDIIFLGMGQDGHTASLFPDYDFNRHREVLVDAPYVQSQRSYRLTLTLPLINTSQTVIFLVTGHEKAATLKKVLSRDSQADILPASRVDAAETIWMIDSEAASALPTNNLRGTSESC